MKVLITGAGGFVGSYLVPHLLARHPDWSLHAWSHGSDVSAEARVSWQAVDITDADAVAAAVSALKPDKTIHLAAISHVPTANKDPRNALRVNLEGTLNLIQALGEHAPGSLLVFVSTSEVYGQTFGSGEALSEQSAFQPMNAYATSKASADLLVGQMSLWQNFHMLRARPFNHIGVGQSEGFVVPAFARQIVAVERGEQTQIKVGNLEAHRDFLDVADVVEAYDLLLTHGHKLPQGAAYNICSGYPTKIQTVLDQLMALAKVPIEVVQDPARMRPSDIPKAQGSYEALHTALGWQPKTPLKTSLERILEAFRQAAR